METQTEKLDFDKVWLMFQETDKRLQDTERILKEQLYESARKWEEMNRDSRRIADELSKEIQSYIKDSKKDRKNYHQKMDELEVRWSKFVESLIGGRLISLLKNWGIKVENTSERRKGRYNDRPYEFDIIAENGDDVVVIEVKTTLKPDHITEFIEELKVFKNIFPIYKDKNILGGVGYINTYGSAEIMAERHGFFVIRATSESAKIINSKEFKPRIW